MPVKWSKFDEKGLARFIKPELPDSFQLPTHIHRSELIHWTEYHQVAKEIYDTLIAENIKYALEPFNSDSNTQMIRTPQEILVNHKEGTCLDLSILFCGICLACDLLPLLIVLHGHALAGVSLHHKREEWWHERSEKERKLFQNGPLVDHEKLKEIINSGDFLPIECTGFVSSFTTISRSMPEGIGRTEKGFLPFERAIEAGKEQLNTPERRLEFALDVAIAHEYWKIKPEFQHQNSYSSKLLDKPATANEALKAASQLLQDKQFDKAEEKFHETQKLGTDLSEYWYWKAQLAVARDNKQVALNYINRALKLNTNYLHGLVMKIKLLLLMGGEYRKEAKIIANRSYHIVHELDLWLDCLNNKNIFSYTVITNSELDKLCSPPVYKW